MVIACPITMLHHDVVPPVLCVGWTRL